MNYSFWGFGLCTLYGALSGVLVWHYGGVVQLSDYTKAFFLDFNLLITGGLILSTVILVYKSQNWIPELIDNTFTYDETKNTEYPEQKRRYLAASRSMSFATTFICVGAFIFHYAIFPFEGVAHYSLYIFACIQYGLGVYVGRKLFYIAQMLHAIHDLELSVDVFTNDKLGLIPRYINSLSTLTLVFVFAHVYSFYNAPFILGTELGDAVRIALLLPAVLALPVIAIFNFYPRSVIKQFYERSIDNQICTIKEKLNNSEISEYERLSYLIEYDKMVNDELKHRMKLTLSDLPFAITIVLMIISLIV